MQNGGKIFMWVVIIVVIVGAVVLMRKNKTDVAMNTDYSSPATQNGDTQNPSTSSSTTSSSSDASLDQKTASIDAEMKGLVSDSKDADSSLNDKQIAQ